MRFAIDDWIRTVEANNFNKWLMFLLHIPPDLILTPILVTNLMLSLKGARITHKVVNDIFNILVDLY